MYGRPIVLRVDAECAKAKRLDFHAVCASLAPEALPLASTVNAS